MDLKGFINKLNEENIRLSKSNNKILVNAPKGSVTDDILKKIKDNKQEIIDYLSNAKDVNNEYISIESVCEKEYYVLSSAQERIYILQQMNPDSTAYSILQCFGVGTYDKINMYRTLKSLIDRHESFRTSFEIVDDIPVQRIHSNVDIDVAKYDVSSTEELEDIYSSFIRSFDLTKAPLLRVGYVKNTSSNENYLMVDMHHIISDGVSMDLL
ncbi:MAG: hypothetical protein GQ534_05460, partial [Candidatus Delongbacteria bacterium]|nr:hypothetical protein [Candidatus Delongbacteria bacterium]